MEPVRRALVPVLCAALALLAWPGGTAEAAPQRLPSAAGSAPVWRAVLEGGVVRQREFDNGADDAAERVTSSARDTYRARATVVFLVGARGVVTGYGSGRYTTARWHLEGVNGTRGRFACDPPMSAPAFAISVTGTVTAGRALLAITLRARESNADAECGAGYTAYATETEYLVESWTAVAGDGLAFDLDAPTVPPLREQERARTATTTRRSTHDWRVTLTPPTTAAAPDRAASVGSEPVAAPPREPGLPDGIGLVPVRSECTVLGTPDDDVLTGTIGRDVICGLGGNDTIASFAGDDVIAGGSGADLIAPGPGRDRVFAGPGADRVGGRDGRHDLINGGPGRDQVWADPGLDETAFAELVF